MNSIKPKIPNFTIVEQCGRGGSSTVWLAIDSDGIRRAIRIMDSVDPENKERIEAEVEISEGRRLCVGMPRKLFFALREGDEAAVCAEAFKKREANTESHVEGYLGADGISVRFTESKRKSGRY